VGKTIGGFDDDRANAFLTMCSCMAAKPGRVSTASDGRLQTPLGARAFDLRLVSNAQSLPDGVAVPRVGCRSSSHNLRAFTGRPLRKSHRSGARPSTNAAPPDIGHWGGPWRPGAGPQRTAGHQHRKFNEVRTLHATPPQCPPFGQRAKIGEALSATGLPSADEAVSNARPRL